MSEATCIEVALGERSYHVLVGQGLLADAGAHLSRLARGGRIAVVSDEAVWSAQGAQLQAGLDRANIEPVPIIVPQGEEAKSWYGLAGLMDRLLSLKIGRSDHIVAFGGGVIGDLGGFAAAILKRGCGFVQVPTTLLAQVDSSVGGKTGINTSAGKNMVGAFHQPSLVLIDPDVLDTLPERQLRAGYAEVVKYGLLGDAGFFAWCEAKGEALLAGDPEARKHAICTSVAAKARIVSHDEREQGGLRALLNLGHTFGHALEAEAGFSERLLHGEAVAIGMVLAFRFSAARGLGSVEDAERVAAHLASAGLPTRFDAEPRELVGHIRHDKKAIGGRVPFVLVRGIGEAFIARDVELEDVEAFLAQERSA